MAIPDLRAEECGRYLTDGIHLFRLLTAPGSPPHGGLVELEDAGTLDHVVLHASDLSRMRSVPIAASER